MGSNSYQKGHIITDLSRLGRTFSGLKYVVSTMQTERDKHLPGRLEGLPSIHEAITRRTAQSPRSASCQDAARAPVGSAKQTQSPCRLWSELAAHLYGCSCAFCPEHQMLLPPRWQLCSQLDCLWATCRFAVLCRGLGQGQPPNPICAYVDRSKPPASTGPLGHQEG
jgi:hypothetical protein